MTDNETTVHLRPKNKDVNNFRSLYDLKQWTNPIVNLYAMKREDNEKQWLTKLKKKQDCRKNT